MDPFPIKHPAVALAKIHEALQPSLKAAGFQFDGRNNYSPTYLYIDYARGSDLFRVAWDRRCRGEIDQFIGFVAEILLEDEQLETIRSHNAAELSKHSRDKLAREFSKLIADFTDAVVCRLDQ